jgi:hypothetical protein
MTTHPDALEATVLSRRPSASSSCLVPLVLVMPGCEGLRWGERGARGLLGVAEQHEPSVWTMYRRTEGLEL